ncbi:MAG: hypothetical protein R2795_25020 [Saprospiraceae bacterium]
MLQEQTGASYFQSGAPLDLSLFNLEKTAYYYLLRDYGYAEFYQTQIDDVGNDGSNDQVFANLYLTVYPPFGDS